MPLAKSARLSRLRDCPRQAALLPVALALLAGLSAPAQQASAGSALVATIKATSRIVYVDVVVHDGFGKIVHGLKEDGFSVTENRQPQKISLFREHEADSASTETSEVGSDVGGSHLIWNVTKERSGAALDMVLLDLIDTAPTDQAYGRIRMIDFLRSLPRGHRVALFILSDQLHMVQGFTSDSASLAKAAESVNIRELGRVHTTSQRITENDLLGMIDSSLDGGSWGVRGTSFLANAIERELAGEDRNNMKSRLDKTFEAFQQLARAVNGVPGRKNLFWLAGEFPSSTYFTLQSLSNTQVGTGGAPGVGAVSENFTGLGTASDLLLHPFSERANRVVADSQIAVYPIDLLGVTPNTIGPESSGIGSAGASTAATASLFADQQFNNRVAMNQIADETGGEAFYGNNDPAQLLKRGFDDGENYYTLAYQPAGHNWNGGFRKISVKLKAAGYHLAYRRGYYALPEQLSGNPTKEFASAMQLETPPSTMLTVSALPPVRRANGVLQLNATLGLEGVTFAADPDEQRKARLQVMLIAYPLVVDAPPSEINNVLALGLTPVDYERVIKTGVSLQQTLHLKPGKYVLRLGVLDTASGRIGTLTLPFTMPAG